MADDDVDAPRHGANLGAGFDAANDHRRRMAGQATISPDAGGDLGCELSRRRQDKRTAASRLEPPSLLGKPVEQRQDEGRGLARPGLGDR